jgi:hypothetical protein
MSDPKDMDAPVTHREMHEALDTWGKRIIDMVTGAMAAMEARFTGAMATMETRLVSMIQASEARLTDELRRATKASEEELTSRIRVIDDKYKDLPDRMARVEAKVFAPKRRRRAR